MIIYSGVSGSMLGWVSFRSKKKKKSQQQQSTHLKYTTTTQPKAQIMKQNLKLLHFTHIGYLRHVQTSQVCIITSESSINCLLDSAGRVTAWPLRHRSCRIAMCSEQKHFTALPTNKRFPLLCLSSWACHTRKLLLCRRTAMTLRHNIWQSTSRKWTHLTPNLTSLLKAQRQI